MTLDWKVSNNRSVQEIVETIRQVLRANGIDVAVTVQEWGTYMKSLKTGQFDLVMAQWVGISGPDMIRQVFHSGMFPPVGANRVHYVNPSFDRLADEASSERVPARRAKLFKEAQKMAFADYAYIPMWHPNIIWVAQKGIKGLSPAPNGSYSSIMEVALGK